MIWKSAAVSFAVVVLCLVTEGVTSDIGSGGGDFLLGSGSGIGAFVWIQNLSIAVEETDENNTVEVCICVRYLEVGLDPQVTVAFSTIPGTADGNDFVPISNQLLIIPLENTTGCQNITIIGDRIVENDEDFIVEVNVTSPLVILNGSNSTTITIIDDDGATVSLNETNIVVQEGDDNSTSVYICVVVADAMGGLQRDIVVNLAMVPDSANSTADFALLESEVVIPPTTAQDQGVCVAVTILGDTIVEGNETFQLMIQPTNPLDMVSPGENTTTVTIVDDDGATVSLNETSIVVQEGDDNNTTVDICVVLANAMGGLQRGIMVELTMVSGNADSTVDFMLLTSEVVIPYTTAQDQGVCVAVTILGDTIVEGNETFQLMIQPTNPLDMVLAGRSTVSVTIVDDDGATVSLNETNIVVQEGDDGNTTVDICVVLADAMGGLQRDIVVDLTVLPDSANSSADFALLESEVVIPPTTAQGQVVCVAAVAIFGDDIVEGNETFQLMIQPTNPLDMVSMGRSTTTVTIVDDDGATVSLNETNIVVQEGDDGNTTVDICVVLADTMGGLQRDIVVDLTVLANNANSSADFALLESEVVIPYTTAQNQVVCVAAGAIFGDDIVEGNETFQVIIQPTNPLDMVSPGGTTTTVTIVDDDGATVFLNETSIVVQEGDDGNTTVDICVVLADTMGGLQRAIVVDLTVLANNANSSADFALLESEVVISYTTVQDQVVCVAAVAIFGDDIVEGNETFQLMIQPTNPLDMVSMGRSTTTITIVDDDGATVSLNETNIVVQEGDDGNTTVDICIVLANVMGGLQRGIMVEITVLPDTANSTADYILLESEVVIPYTTVQDQVVCVAAVAIFGDDIVEGNETFQVIIQPTNPLDMVSMGRNTTTVTIVDDDGATVSVNEINIVVQEGDDGNTTVDICIVLENDMGGLQRDIVVDLTVIPDTANSSTDFALLEGEVVISYTTAQNQVVCVAAVAIFGDNIVEGNETFQLMIQPTNSLDMVSMGRSTTTITIVDDDGATVFLNETNIVVQEGDDGNTTVDICIVLANVMGGLQRGIMVEITVLPDTANSSADFQLTANEVVLPPTTAQDQVVCVAAVAIFGDDIVEGNETFQVIIQPTNPLDMVSMGRNTTTITIVDDDGATVYLNETNIVVQEGDDGNTTVDICIFVANDTGSRQRDIVLYLTVVPDNASMDFMLLAREVVIPYTTVQGQGVCVAGVTIFGDYIVERNETFQLMIQPTNPLDMVLASRSTVSVTIVDDDGATVSLNETNIVVQEGDDGNTTVDICVVLADAMGGLQRDIVVDLTVMSVSANTDFMLQMSEVVIPPATVQGQGVCVAAILIVGDNLVEGNETFQVMIQTSNPLDMVLADRSTVNVTIVDDDGAVVYLNETSIVIPEGDDGNTTVDICIVLANVTRDLERDIVVDLTVMPDNANSTVDFALLESEVVIPSMTVQDQVVCVAAVAIFGDNIVEGNETFQVIIQPTNPLDMVSMGRNTTTVTIVDDDGATVYLNETNIVVQEGDDGNTTVDICIVLADDMGGLQRNIVVDLTVMPDISEDFMLLAREVVIPYTTVQDQVVCVAAVAILGDTIVEGNETFQLMIQPTNPLDMVSPGENATTITIVDNDGATVSLNETNIVVQEGDNNSTTVDICVVVADDMGGLQRDIVVDLTVMSVTANSSVDFMLLEREVVIQSATAQDQGVCVAAIAILGDYIVEGNETFRVIIQPTNPLDMVSLGGNAATVTIIDDDGATVYLSETDIVVSEGDVSSTGFTTTDICVVLAGAMGGLQRNIVVDLTVVSDNANSTADFALLVSEVVIPFMTVQGQGVCVAAIAILGDDIVEGNETFRVIIQPTNPLDMVSPGGTTTTVTIVDDDGATVYLNETNIVVQEGVDSSTSSALSVDICIVVANTIEGLQRDIMVDLTVIPGNADSTTDFMLVEMQVVIPSMTAQGQVFCVTAVTIVDDDIVEGNETFQLMIQPTNPLDMVLAGRSTVSVTIIDDDGATVSLNETNIVVQEGDDGNTTVDICIVLADDMGGLQRDIVVDLTVLPDSANSTVDFVLLESEVVIPSTTAQDQVVCVAAVAIFGDTIVEGSETFQLMIQPRNPLDMVVAGRSTLNVTIVDDDGATVSLNETNIVVQEGDDGNTTVDICIVLADDMGGLQRDIVVDLTVLPDSANSTVDFVLLESEVVIPSTTAQDQVVCVAAVAIFGDTIVEGSETFQLMIQPRNPLDMVVAGRSTLNVTIVDDDGATVSLNETNIVVQEGDDGNTTVDICIVLADDMGDLQRDIVVDLTVLPDSANSTVDFVLLESEVVIPSTTAQDQVVCVAAVAIFGDTIVEGSETFQLMIQPRNPLDMVMAGRSTLNVTIVDDDEPEPPTVTPLVEGVDYIRFLTLGANGVPTNFIARSTRIDDISSPIYIPFGLPFGESIQRTAYVSTNGAISFGTGWFFWTPQPFPTTSFFTRNSYVVAPFWSDNDIRINGSIRYEVHSRVAGPNTTSTRLLNEVSSFIINQRNLTADSFQGQWMLVAEWNEVHPYPHGDSTFASSSAQLNTFVERANTYQAIVITDGTQSYAVYTYNCQMMEWSGLFTHAVVGYNAFGQDFENHPLSGSADITDIACENQERNTDWSNQLFRIGDSRDLIQQRRAECTRRISEDVTTFDNIPSEVAQIAAPCPCSFFQAVFDRRFFFQLGIGLCVAQRFPNIRSGVAATQLCCYDVNLRTLLTSGEGGSSLLLFHPVFFTESYVTYDRELRRACCGLAGMCGQFYTRRPPNDCSLYRPPVRTWGWGDPHITTLDDEVYTFNGLGEYTLLQLTPASDNDDFTLQGRTELVVNSTATQFSAFAFGSPSADMVEVRYENGSFVVLHNGIDISSNLTNVNDTYTTQAIQITRTGTDSVTSAFPSGAGVTIRVAENIPNFVLTLPQSFMGQTRGLLGNYNGDSSDEFLYPNGTMLISNASDSMIHDFGQAWQISQNESLFTYADGQNVTTFANLSHVPVFLDEVVANTAPEIVQSCNNDPMCIFDYNQTGDANVGMATLTTNQNNNNDQMQALNFPPAFSGAPRFRVNTGEESIYAFNVTDSDNFNASVMGETPSNASLETNGTAYTFRWVLALPDNISVAFSAVDSLQARSVLNPQVEICACANGGTCTLDGILDLDADPVVMNCECPEAWTGQFCEEDIDGCSVVSCFEGVQCSDVQAPGTGATCGPCPAGYTGDGVKCSDVDECSTNTNPCEQVCVNTAGSFQCSCFSGFRLVNGSSTQCEDINECDMVNDCHQECINTNGSFICDCLEGFELDSNNRTCSVMSGSQCPQNNSCSQICLRMNGTLIEECSCMRGYQLSNDNTTCIDVDECMLQPPCQQSCNNTVGSFVCTCESGFRLNANGVTCDDIDECREAALDRRTLCPQPQLCEDTPGSYQCECPPGTEMINTTCREIAIPEPTPTPALVSSTPATEQPTVTPTLTPIATPIPTQIPEIARNNALRVTLSQYTAENFTSAVQERFRNTTAMVINRYCDGNNEQCNETVTVARRRRQVSRIQPSDVIITNITNNAQGVLEFVMYIQVAGGARVLRVEVLESAVQNGTTDYMNAGFAGARFDRVIVPTVSPTESPTASAGLSSGQIAGIIIGSVFGVLLLLLLLVVFILLCYKYCRCNRKGGFTLTYGVVYKEPENDYVVHNEIADVDDTSVHSMKLTFAESGTPSPEPKDKDDDDDIQEVVTAL